MTLKGTRNSIKKIEEYEDDSIKFIVLGDKETDGARFATALITFKSHTTTE
jgi:hypothetical protein